MEKVIGGIELDTSSPWELAKAVLEKVVAIYVTMRNRLCCVGGTTMLIFYIPPVKRKRLKE
jgi:hypothetical protein